MFVHKPLDLLEYDTINIEGKRFYQLPNGNYPSITTVLSSLSKDSIEKWKKSIGTEEAEKISKYASERGTAMHLLCEEYLNNVGVLGESLDSTKETEDAIILFESLRPELDKINNILGQEKVLYSDRLKVAGRVDCIGEYNGVLSIIDFKTAKKPKKEEWIQNYFMQATFYALCVYELTGVKVKNLAILIAVDNKPPQVFTKEIKPYIDNLLKVIRNFEV